MDINQLEYFINLADTENMGKSADILHISQPALSMSMKRLESELGIDLFDRRNHNIYLNSYGRLFLRFAQASVKNIEEGKHELLLAIQSKQNKISISCPLYYLTGLIYDAFCDIDSNAIVEYQTIPYWMTEDAILNKTLDICITITKAQSDRIENVFLANRTMGVICPKGHRFENRTCITISDLKEENHLSYPESKPFRYDLEMLCSRRGFKPNVVFEAESFLALLQMCRKGRGVLMTSQTASNICDMNGLFFVPFDPNEADSQAQLYMLSLKDNTNPHIQKFKDVILNVFSNS